MANSDNLFDSWIKEAMEELGNHGWRDASQNAVTLVAFGMLTEKINKRVDRIVKPAWVIALSVLSSAVWFIISKILGL